MGSLDACLRTGAIGEEQCTVLLEQFGAAVWTARERREQRAGIDLWVQPPSGREYSVQVKYDAKSRETGMAYVEYATWNIGAATPHPSGLATCAADRVMLVFPGRGILSATPRLLLEAARAEGLVLRSRVNRDGGRQWQSLGYLVRIALLAERPDIAWFPEVA